MIPDELWAFAFSSGVVGASLLGLFKAAVYLASLEEQRVPARHQTSNISPSFGKMGSSSQ